MKRLLLIFGCLLWLFASSCISDDNGNDTVVIGEKYISEIITEVFNSADVQTDYRIKHMKIIDQLSMLIIIWIV